MTDLGHKFLTNAVQIFVDFWTILKQRTFEEKTAFATFKATLWKIGLLFILVTLRVAYLG